MTVQQLGSAALASRNVGKLQLLTEGSSMSMQFFLKPNLLESGLQLQIAVLNSASANSYFQMLQDWHIPTETKMCVLRPSSIARM